MTITMAMPLLALGVSAGFVMRVTLKIADIAKPRTAKILLSLLAAVSLTSVLWLDYKLWQLPFEKQEKISMNATLFVALGAGALLARLVRKVPGR